MEGEDDMGDEMIPNMLGSAATADDEEMGLVEEFRNLQDFLSQNNLQLGRSGIQLQRTSLSSTDRDVTHPYEPVGGTSQNLPQQAVVRIGGSGLNRFAFDRPAPSFLFGSESRQSQYPAELEQMLADLLRDSDESKTPKPPRLSSGRGLFDSLSEVFSSSLSSIRPANTSADRQDSESSDSENEFPSVPPVTDQQPQTPQPGTPTPILQQNITIDESDAMQLSAITPVESVATPSSEVVTPLPEPVTPIVEQQPQVEVVSESVSATPEPSVVAQQEPVATSAALSEQNFAIDPQFLAAIPDDLRQEVLATHIASLVDTTSTSEESTISPEFLNALPLEIRNEVLQQERELREQAQRRREQSRPSVVQETPVVASASSSIQQDTPNAGASTTVNPPETLVTSPVNMPPPPPSVAQDTDFDTATFLASLPPDLREEILLTTDEAVLANLPPDMAAEAYNLRNQHYNRQRRQFRRQHHIENSRSNVISKAVKQQILTKEKTQEQVEPLFKEEDIISLLKLLYMSMGVGKDTLQGILTELCTLKESRKSLVELLTNIVLYHATPIEQIPEKMRPLCMHKIFEPPKQEGFFKKDEESTIPLLVIHRVLETLIGLTKNALVLSLLTETEFISEEENIEPKRDTLSKLFSLLTSKSLCSLNTTYELYLNLLDTCAEYISKMVQTLTEEVSKMKNQLKAAEERLPKVEQQPSEPTKTESSEITEANMKDSNDEKMDTTEETPEEKTVKDLKENLSKTSKKLEMLLNYATNVFNHQVITDLVSVLSTIDFSERVVKIATSIMDNISCSLPIRISILKVLSLGAKEEARVVKETLHKLSTQEKTHKAPVDINAIEKLKFCRILKSYGTVLKKYKKEKQKEAKDTLLDLSNDPNLLSEYSLDFVWESLDRYLQSIPADQDVIESKGALNSLKKKKKSSAIYAALFPFVEAFFSFHAGFIEEKEKKEALLSEMVEGTTPTSAKGFGEKSKVETFLERHRDFLNTLARSNPSLLNTTLSLFMKYPKYVDFDNKISWFRSKLAEEQRKSGLEGATRVSLRREHIFVDSFVQIRQKTAEECKSKINVRFQGEEGVDAGGLTREWFLLLSKEMLNPNYALFIPCADKTTYQPNPSSYINSEHLSYFQFIGRVISMAIYNEQYLDCHFTRSFYKHILGTPITYHDIESIDPDYYKNLNWMLKNDIEDVLDYNFTQEVDEFGQRKQIDLKPNGKNIPVTNENKAEYVRLVTELKMTKSIEKQLNSFLKSFYEIIPRKLIQVFNEQELELLISGLPDLDIQDLRNNTEYVGYTSDSLQIKWFWNIVEGFDRNEKALLLQFVTGTSKIPLGGFSQLMGTSGVQRFNIHKAKVTNERLPTSHTCFNQLDLPEYESEELLHERLLLAIREGSEGFGFI